MEGIAVLRASRKDRECLGTASYLWRHFGGGGDWLRDYPRRTLKPTYEALGPQRYRLTFPFRAQDLGGPCRWQLVSVQLLAHRPGGDTPGIIVYTSANRELDLKTQLWQGGREPPQRLVIRCLEALNGTVFETCDDQIPGDRRIPEFVGILTIPLDVFVPGGIKATVARLQRQQALEPDRIAADEVGAQADRKREELTALTATGGHADASSVAAHRARLEAEISALDRDYEARAKRLAEKRAVIVATWEQERVPDPPAPGPP